MALSEDAKRAMIVATHEAALAMVDDLQHIRETLAKPEPTPGDIRRMSGVLRRLLTDNGGDLRKVAPPRMGRRMQFTAPDVLPFFRSGEKKPLTFLTAGVADVFGLSIDAISYDSGPVQRSTEYHPEKTVLLHQDGFLSQKIICFKGRWVSRSDVIKYVANVASGVHSGEAKEPNHQLLATIRHAASIKLLENGDRELRIQIDAMDTGDKVIAVDRKALDIVLMQLLSTARYMTMSADVIELEANIKREEIT